MNFGFVRQHNVFSRLNSFKELKPARILGHSAPQFTEFNAISKVIVFLEAPPYAHPTFCEIRFINEFNCLTMDEDNYENTK